MSKAPLIRIGGILLAAIAFVPACVFLLKALPLDTISALHGFYWPLWWWRWVWSWMPSIIFLFSESADILWALPGSIAMLAVGAGLILAFGTRKTCSKPQPWEDEP